MIADLSPIGPPIRQLAAPFIISAGLGALIGLVRQWAWQQAHPEEAEYAGVRTFTIWAVLGCATALISERFGVAVFSGALAGLCILLTAARLRARPEQAEGYTTFAVMMETFSPGAVVCIDERNIAVMLAAGTMVLREFGEAARGLPADANLAPALAAGANDLRNHRLHGVVPWRKHPSLRATKC